jgi:hypothetical protein
MKTMQVSIWWLPVAGACRSQSRIGNYARWLAAARLLALSKIIGDIEHVPVVVGTACQLQVVA